MKIELKQFLNHIDQTNKVANSPTHSPSGPLCLRTLIATETQLKWLEIKSLNCIHNLFEKKEHCGQIAKDRRQIYSNLNECYVTERSPFFMIGLFI